MGREATVQCQWAEETARCTVLLESSGLILRGGLRRRAPLSRLREISVDGEHLRFRVGEDRISLSLGSDLARRWAKALTTPPPSLSGKLGISAASRLLLVGEVECDELKAAIAQAGAVSGEGANLVLACVKTRADLDRAFDRFPKHPARVPPVWIVYPKGKNGAIGESTVREVLRNRGFVDTKVASISEKLTALRFVDRRG